MSGFSKLRVLFIGLEYHTWYYARHLSYCAQLGLEEGLQASGVDYFTITMPWLGRARELLEGKRFDQVWIELIPTGLFELVHRALDKALYEWIAELAPIRVGFLTESMEYSPEEYVFSPTHPLRGMAMRKRRSRLEKRIQYMTHVVACDEKDADDLAARGPAQAMWWPQAVPERFICEKVPTMPKSCAIFGGALYGERARWLERPDLKGMLVHPPPPERYPFLFDALHMISYGSVKSRLPGYRALHSRYLHTLRRIRQECFADWLKGLQTGSAVVNLPHFVKSYAGRVVEGMAAGRPVISWEIPDRPQNRALFEDGKEILLFDKNDPAQLAVQIRRLLSDSDFGRRIAMNARRKLKQFHAIEKRVRQILDWVATGDKPTYF
ncbi:MAG: glycosyltransferase family 1 protein [Nitrospirae bacterium]|nr:glycosyltransferase family 1 protein [Nitrospirota bacterium]